MLGGGVWLVIFVFFQVVRPIYVSKSNPYNQGELSGAYLSIDQVPDLRGWLNVYYPTQQDQYAVVLFMSGLYSDVPGGYNQLLSHLPTHGIIAVSIQSILEVPSDSLYLLYANIIQFLDANLTKYLPPGVEGDVKGSLVGMGHSAGAKIIVKTLLEECTFLKAAILHSPVDGLDPWGWINDYVLNPPNLVNFSTPVLLMGTGLESLPGNEFVPPCGPPGRNFHRFFSCLRPDMWFLTALDYGHADFLDDALWETLYYTQFCKTTTDVNGRQYYIDFVAGAITAFVVGVVQGNCPTLDYLTNPTTFPIPNVDVNSTKIVSSCPSPTCTRD